MIRCRPFGRITPIEDSHISNRSSYQFCAANCLDLCSGCHSSVCDALRAGTFILAG
jgi:hypothetical protein